MFAEVVATLSTQTLDKNKKPQIYCLALRDKYENMQILIEMVKPSLLKEVFQGPTIEYHPQDSDS